MQNETIQYVPVDKVETDEQVRKQFDQAAIHGLMLSLLECGQLQPIRVRRLSGERFIVVDGERRLRAARLARWKTIACIVEDKELDSAAVTHRQLVANCQRESLTALEMAQAIDDLMHQTKWSAAETAAKLGLSEAAISKSRGLLLLPEAVRRNVESGKIPASAAYELSRIDDASRQAELAEEVAAGRMTRDELSRVIRKARNGGQAQNVKPAARATVALGENRSITVAGNGLSLESLIAWLEETLGRARKARTQGLALGTFIKMARDQATAK